MIDKETEKRVLDFIASARDPIHSTEIAKKLGINRVTVTKYLSVLHSKTLIDFKNVGMAKVWMLVENPLFLAFEQNDVNNTMIHALNSMPDGVCVLDRTLGIVWLNREMEKRHGKLGKLKGRKCFEVFHNEKDMCENCPSWRSFETGERAHVTIEKTGHKIELSTSPLKNRRGKTVAVIESINVVEGKPTRIVKK